MNRGAKKPLRLWRIGTALFVIFAAVALGYWLWRPGLDVRDGRHDLRRNGIWIAHGWLGADDWFIENGKTNEFQKYREPANVRALAAKLRQHSITDVFPHLCPAEPNGRLPSVNAQHVERFLDAFEGFRVMPWIGGPNGVSVRPSDAKWRKEFVTQIRQLLETHARFAGIHLNVEPLPSGDRSFIALLQDLRNSIPRDKVLSVAAYPPPTRWHPFPDVHWDEPYFREVAKHSDQLAVMMYDAAQKLPKTYQKLMADWTEEVLAWSEGRHVLLGVPTYDDAGVDYHDPKVENLTNALLGIHRGLTRRSMPTNYQGIAIYCDWETSDSEWTHLQNHFLK